MAKHITINGTNYVFSSIKLDGEKVGEELRADSGKRNWVHRSNKRVWDISFQGVTESIRSALYAVWTLTTTFTFIDVTGVSYTVQMQSDSYKQSTDADHYDPGADTLRWDVDIRLYEQ